MDLLIIRHAESEYNVGASQDLNSQLTSDGHSQGMITADWIDRNVKDISEFIPMTSPYRRTIQTSLYFDEVVEDLQQFQVEYNLREFHVNKDHPQLKDGGMFVRFDYNIALDFEWPEPLAMGKIFPNEDIEAFFVRVQSFLDSLDQNGKYLFISHGATCRTIHALATGGDLDELRDRYSKPITDEKNLSIQNCSVTSVRNGKEEWFSKVAYEYI